MIYFLNGSLKLKAWVCKPFYIKFRRGFRTDKSSIGKYSLKSTKQIVEGKITLKRLK